MVIDRLLYCRYMADYTVYDADDIGRAAGPGFQYAGGRENLTGSGMLQQVFSIKLPVIKPVLTDSIVRKDH